MRRAGFSSRERDAPTTSLILNPKSKIQNPKSNAPLPITHYQLPITQFNTPTSNHEFLAYLRRGRGRTVYVQLIFHAASV